MKILIENKYEKDELDKIKKNLSQHELRFVNQIVQSNVDWSEIILGTPSTELNLNKQQLKLLQLRSAGSEKYVDVLHDNTILCNASGCYGIVLSEHVISLLLALSKNIPEYVQNMKNHLWKKSITKEIFHSKVCILGCGDIGQNIAKRLSMFDCHITGVKRRKSSSIPYFDEIKTISEIDAILQEMDIIIMCLPETKDTIGLIDKNRLRLMKSDAILINVGRGSAIVHDDLVKVIQSHLWGVGLDVTYKEPLPQNDPLWENPKVIITPHSAGGFGWKSVRNNYIDLCTKNIECLLNREECFNVVDKTSGYRKKTN